MKISSKPMKGETDQQAGQGTKQSIAKDSMLSFLPPSGHVAPQALLKLNTAKSLFFQSLEVFLLGLVRRLHEAESEENCLNRQYLIMLEVPKVLASLDKKMNPNGGDFLELSNIHSYLFALLCQWNSHVFYGTGMALESFGSYLTSIFQHSGGIEHNVRSARHYMCDVKNIQDNKWYHTSDSTEPRVLRKNQVTKNGFIVLYKRKSD